MSSVSELGNRRWNVENSTFSSSSCFSSSPPPDTTGKKDRQRELFHLFFCCFSQFQAQQSLGVVFWWRNRRRWQQQKLLIPMLPSYHQWKYFFFFFFKPHTWESADLAQPQLNTEDILGIKSIILIGYVHNVSNHLSSTDFYLRGRTTWNMGLYFSNKEISKWH